MIDSLALILAFTLGLFSTLHCLGMCGGVISALSCSVAHPISGDPLRRNGYVLLFNLGRITIYTLFGLIVGAGGSALINITDPALWRQLATTVAGLSMILIGIYLGGWSPVVRRIDLLGRGIWRRMQPLAQRLMPIKGPGSALAAGLVWGWLPCGLVYYALLVAAPLGSAVDSALFMLAFGLGTVPSMQATGAFGGLLARLTRHDQIRQLAAFTIMLIGFGTLIIGQTDIPHQLMPASAGHGNAQHEH